MQQIDHASRFGDARSRAIKFTKQPAYLTAMAESYSGHKPPEVRIQHACNKVAREILTLLDAHVRLDVLVMLAGSTLKQHMYIIVALAQRMSSADATHMVPPREGVERQHALVLRGGIRDSALVGVRQHMSDNETEHPSREAGYWRNSNAAVKLQADEVQHKSFCEVVVLMRERVPILMRDIERIQPSTGLVRNSPPGRTGGGNTRTVDYVRDWHASNANVLAGHPSFNGKQNMQKLQCAVNNFRMTSNAFRNNKVSGMEVLEEPLGNLLAGLRELDALLTMA